MNIKDMEKLKALIEAAAEVVSSAVAVGSGRDARRSRVLTRGLIRRRAKRSGMHSAGVDRLHRHPHRRAQAAHRAVAERDVAAMRAGDVAGDGEPQPGAAFVLVAGVVQPQERLEHFLAHLGGMPGPSSSTVTVR